jgi:hypothetical protein
MHGFEHLAVFAVAAITALVGFIWRKLSQGAVFLSKRQAVLRSRLVRQVEATGHEYEKYAMTLRDLHKQSLVALERVRAVLDDSGPNPSPDVVRAAMAFVRLIENTMNEGAAPATAERFQRTMSDRIASIKAQVR